MLKPKTIATNIPKVLLTLFFLINFFLIGIYSNPAFAQTPQPTPLSRNLVPTDPATAAKIIEALGNSTCPDPIKQLYLKQDSTGNWVPRDDRNAGNTKFYLSGTLIVARDGSGNDVNLSCASASALQKIAMRGFMLLFTLIGVVLAFGAGRSAINMITAFGDEEKFKDGAKGLVTSISYTVGALFFYTIFVFVLVGILGFGRVADRPEYNLFCQQRIVFNLTFDQNEPC